jgi:hypothetical protein
LIDAATWPLRCSNTLWFVPFSHVSCVFNLIIFFNNLLLFQFAYDRGKVVESVPILLKALVAKSPDDSVRRRLGFVVESLSTKADPKAGTYCTVFHLSLLFESYQ